MSKTSRKIFQFTPHRPQLTCVSEWIKMINKISSNFTRPKSLDFSKDDHQGCFPFPAEETETERGTCQVPPLACHPFSSTLVDDNSYMPALGWAVQEWVPCAWNGLLESGPRPPHFQASSFIPWKTGCWNGLCFHRDSDANATYCLRVSLTTQESLTYQ